MAFSAFREIRARWAGVWARLVCEESAQDLIEYGLLAAFIGVVGILVLDAIGVEILNTYMSWIDPTVGVPSLWDPPEPLGSAP